MDTKKKSVKSLKTPQPVLVAETSVQSLSNTNIAAVGTKKRKRNRQRKFINKDSDAVIDNIEKVNDINPPIPLNIVEIKYKDIPSNEQCVKGDEIDIDKNKNIEIPLVDAGVEKKEPIKPILSSNMQSEQEKLESREKIKAEREAKKKAKQSAKNKKKDANDKSEIKENVEKKTDTEKNVTTDSIQAIDQNEIIKPDTILKPKNKDNEKSTIKTEIQATDANKIPETEKSKSDLRAERRAKQEAQRLAKVQAKTIPQKEEKNTKAITSSQTKTVKKKIIATKPTSKPSRHQVKLFIHLYIKTEAPNIPLNSKEIHSSIIRLGVKYATHVIVGSNSRCRALLYTLKQVIDDYTLPPNEEFSRGFEAHLTPCENYLKMCRPFAVSMSNALKNLKWHLTQMPNNITEDEAKDNLKNEIETYITNQIDIAADAISQDVNKKIRNGDVILTYGCSSLIEQVLGYAKDEKKIFRVVVVVANPWNEGREMLRRLSAKGIKCSLIMISALSFIMREIQIVVLGAGALLANGYVMARAGTAQVAMVANAHNVPVLVCCETYKFSERVQTDSFVYNEIGNPDDLVKSYALNVESPLVNWRDLDTLTPLNLTYDVTPPDLVTAVFTERAVIPCTSVPVILRLIPESKK